MDTPQQQLPASSRLAYLGAIQGLPELDEQHVESFPSFSLGGKGKGKLLESSEKPLPRFSVMFSQSAINRMRGAGSVNLKMNHFFQKLGQLTQELNQNHLADCQFLCFEHNTGQVRELGLSFSEALVDEHQEDTLDAQDATFSGKGSLMRQTKSALEADQLMGTVYEQMEEQLDWYHPDLLVSDEAQEVKTALHQGTPAILVRFPDGDTEVSSTETAKTPKTNHSNPLLVALDFDCTLFGGSGEWLFIHALGHLKGEDKTKQYNRVERIRSSAALGPGPMLHFVQALVGLKKLLAKLPTPLDDQLRFAVITARSFETRGRVHHNLSRHIPDYASMMVQEDVPETQADQSDAYFFKHQGVHFMNGAPKLPRLLKLDTDIFIDDSGSHTAKACDQIPTGQVLWGPGHEDADQVFEFHPSLMRDGAQNHNFKPRVHVLPHSSSN